MCPRAVKIGTGPRLEVRAPHTVRRWFVISAVFACFVLVAAEIASVAVQTDNLKLWLRRLRLGRYRALGGRATYVSMQRVQ
jgi:hypothetical protein